MDSFPTLQSLQDLTARRVAITLWNQRDVRNLVINVNNLYIKNQNLWPEIENTVIKNVNRISEPKAIKQEVLSWIKPIGSEILKWISHNFHASLHMDLPNEFCWISYGILDEKKTAGMLIKDTNIDVVARYKLACIYCLKDDIPKLWNKIPENRKQLFFTHPAPINDRQHSVVLVWTYDINEQIAKLGNIINKGCLTTRSPYQQAFENAVHDGILESTEYFYIKLNPRERAESLSRSARLVGSKCFLKAAGCRMNDLDEAKCFYMDVLRFILSEMHENLNILPFRFCSYYVLQCFLEWPWQVSFVDVAKRLLRFVSEGNFERLLNAIVNKVLNSYKDYTYETLFEKLWQESQDSHKRYVIRKCVSRGSMLGEMVRVANKKQKRKFVSVILADADSTEKEMIFFEGEGKEICKVLFYNDDLELLSYFVRKCISSQEKIMKFREEFKQRELSYFTENESSKLENKLHKFFQMLDGNI